jgi:CBS domain containing-hemolysin-like protein
LVENPLLFSLLILFLVLMNGFFVAAEFSLVRARASRIRELIALGSKRARRVQQVTKDLNRTLSSCQLGITLASIGLGFVGEHFFSDVLKELMHWIGINLADTIISIIAFTIGYMIITFLHVTLGELVPKTLSIEFTEKTALWTAEPLYWFMVLTTPMLNFFVSSANVFQYILRIPVRTETPSQVYTEEELKIIIRDSIKQGEIELYESKLIFNILEFTDKTVKDLLTPRIDIVALPVTSSPVDIFNLSIETGFSRIPIYQDNLDDVLGFIHIKDVFAHIKLEGKSEEKFDISSIVRPAIIIHEAKPIDDLLKEMQEQQTQVSIVVDEYGSVEGLVTLEDIMESIIGPIADEFDPRELIHESIEVKGDILIVGGLVSIEQFNQIALEKIETTIEALDSITIAGYVLELFGSEIPKVGDEVRDNVFSYKICSLDRNRIVSIEVQKID